MDVLFHSHTPQPNVWSVRRDQSMPCSSISMKTRSTTRRNTQSSTQRKWCGSWWKNTVSFRTKSRLVYERKLAELFYSPWYNFSWMLHVMTPVKRNHMYTGYSEDIVSNRRFAEAVDWQAIQCADIKRLYFKTAQVPTYSMCIGYFSIVLWSTTRRISLYWFRLLKFRKTSKSQDVFNISRAMNIRTYPQIARNCTNITWLVDEKY